jgi:hypothetical protein
VRLAFAFIGLFGVAFAVTGMLVPLPKPAVPGTCGPGRDSETAIEALFNPGSIGAGPEPPASQTAAHQEWQDFVDDCQATTDNRAGAALAIIVVSVGVAFVGPVLVAGRKKRRPPPGPSVTSPMTSPL